MTDNYDNQSKKEENVREKLEIEFGPAFSATEAAEAFTVDFLDEARCREWVFKRIHAENINCPHCDANIVDATTTRNFLEGRCCRCKNCGRRFTALSGTSLQKTHLSFRQLYLMAVLVNFKLTPQRIAPILGLSYDVVRRWIHRFKEL